MNTIAETSPQSDAVHDPFVPAQASPLRRSSEINSGW